MIAMFEKILYIIIIIIIFIFCILFLVKKIFIPIIKEIRKYKKLDEKNKDTINILLFIFIAPFILFALDAFNSFSKIFPRYNNLSREYDWLSFVGTYSGAIVSAILLILITEKEREENTNVIRESQRPYLDVCFMKIKESFFIKQRENIFCFDHGNKTDKSVRRNEYLTLCIKNNGSSVAIIDINSTRVILEYIESNKIEQKSCCLNASVTRLSIKSGEEIYIRFFNKNLYEGKKLSDKSKIISSKIIYKDLFNKQYIDECELKENLIVIHDNEEI